MEVYESAAKRVPLIAVESTLLIQHSGITSAKKSVNHAQVAWCNRLIMPSPHAGSSSLKQIVRTSQCGTALNHRHFIPEFFIGFITNWLIPNTKSNQFSIHQTVCSCFS